MQEVSLSSANWLKQSIKEAQIHPGAQLMDKFMFNKEALEPNELAEIQSHIDSCDRCRDEFEYVSQRKEAYLSSRSLT